MLKVKGILLDLDGTIVDSKEAYVEAFKAALSAIGRKNIDVKKATEIPRRLEQNLPIDDLVGKANVQRFLEAYLKTYYETTVRKGKLMPHNDNQRVGEIRHSKILPVGCNSVEHPSS